MTALILLALFAFADRPPLDAVVLVEDSPRTRTLEVELSLTAGDRMAIMTFNNKARVKRRFTGDPARIATALRPPKLGVAVFRKADARIHVLDAIVEANNLFSTTPPSDRQRAIFVLFASEDDHSQADLDTIRAALARTNAKLAAAGTEGEVPVHPDEPTLPVKHLDPPDRTIEAISKLTPHVVRNSWNVTRLIELVTGTLVYPRND